jgi:DNA-binding transcriptional LysR family regulator
MSTFEPSIPAMRLVVEIVKTGKLTTAAARLGVSQSGASHALRVLESQIGAALFVREWEGLRLSEAGQRLLPYIEQTLGSLDAIRAEAAGLSQLKTGNLRIAAVPSLLATILPPLLREYGARYPGIELSIFEGTDDEVRIWIISGMAHVGFAALPVEDVSGEEVAEDEWLALVPHRMFSGRSSTTLRELARHNFLMSGGGCEAHIQRIFSAARIEVPNRLMVKQLPTIQAMVAEELGVSLVPSLSVKNMIRGNRVLHLKPRLNRKIGMLRPIGGASTSALDAWAALTKSKLKRSSISVRKDSSANAKGPTRF